MSRIGKKPIPIPEKVEIVIDGPTVRVKGPLGELAQALPGEIKVERKGSQLELTTSSTARDGMAMYGTARARLANLITGVHLGFKKDLEIQGVGFKASIKGQELGLTLGFSHPVVFDVPVGIKIEVDKKATKVTVAGADKELVGETAARIRQLKPPEPYKGTGIRYVGERVRRKAGKTAAGAGGGGAAGAKK